MQSYDVATARVVLNATGVITPRGTFIGRVVLNVTDRGRKVGVTVEDNSTGGRGRAVVRLDRHALRSTVLLGSDQMSRATLNSHVR